jgi:hypothetical protein
MNKSIRLLFIAALTAGFLAALPQYALAHCDTLDGPVVMDAKAALEKGDATPVLKWMAPAQEAEVKSLFEKTIAVRTLSPTAKELADMYFFETLVRLHRATEGAPYTGLKPAGTVDPAIAAADRALESGKADPMVKEMIGDAASGIQKRFHHAYEAKQKANESVEAGREYVHAYVEYIHYVERLHNDITTSAAGHAEAGQAGEDRHGH